MVVVPEPEVRNDFFVIDGKVCNNPKGFWLQGYQNIANLIKLLVYDFK